MNDTDYPIGRPGQPWDEAEKATWLQLQQVQRRYSDDVLTVIEDLRRAQGGERQVLQYGTLDYDEARYPLYAIVSESWNENLPAALVTGGVHGYETSGVHGALRFARDHWQDYASRCNLVVAPCISPWGYETINRWNPLALDPNRSFVADSPAQECASLMAFLAEGGWRFDLHMDLHETTDTDNTEFRRALAARDGKEAELWDIPDGFYAVGDSGRPEPDFQRAVIEAVAEVTHIAPADAQGRLIGEPLQQTGVINYPVRELGLCAGITDARFVCTTEVYPDSPRVDDENCVQAQVRAVTAALDYLLAGRAAPR